MKQSGNVKLKEVVERVVLAIDFDGTICEVAYPEIGMERYGAKEHINRLYEEGYIIIINSCRTDGAGIQPATMAQEFLKLRGINYHFFNENWPDLINLYGTDCRKISADIYIDDKCLFQIPTWKEKYKIITQRFPNPFNKNDR